MLKKLLTILVAIAAFGMMAGCEGQNAAPSSTREESSTEGTFQEVQLKGQDIAKDLAFCKGEEKKENVLLSREKVSQIRTQYDPILNRYQLCIELTEEGTQTWAKATREMSQSGETVSVWAKGERIASAAITDEISNGQFVLSGDYGQVQIAELIEKFRG